MKEDKQHRKILRLRLIVAVGENTDLLVTVVPGASQRQYEMSGSCQGRVSFFVSIARPTGVQSTSMTLYPASPH